MGTRTTRVLAVIGAVAVLVVGVNAAAYAATGKSLILGKKNTANKVTTVERTTNGPALTLKTRNTSAAPFTTNAKGRVINLSADKLDGYDASYFTGKSAAALAAANDIKAIKFKDATGTRAGNTTYAIGTIPAGTYAVSMNAAVTLPTAGTMTCSLFTATGSPLTFTHYYATNTATSSSAFTSPSFSTVLTVDGTEPFKLGCSTSGGDGWTTAGGFITISGEAPSISFTKLDGVSNRSLAP